LHNRKFEIQSGCTLFGGHPSVEISRNKRGFFAFIHGDTDLYQLVRVVNYFASENWQSFCYNVEDVDSAVALKTFNSILEKDIGNPQTDFFENKYIQVWAAGGLQIIYKPDGLFYKFNEKDLKMKPSNPLPAKLKNRYFIVKHQKIQVIEEGKTILEYNIPDFDEIMPFLYRMKSYRKWLNVYYEGKPILSYSYEKNSFYKIQNNK
jgi:hypothetical protein